MSDDDRRARERLQAVLHPYNADGWRTEAQLSAHLARLVALPFDDPPPPPSCARCGLDACACL